MARKRRLPGLHWHPGNQQWYVRIQGKFFYLGSQEEKAEAERLRLLAEWQASGQIPGSGGEKTSGVTVAELCNEYTTRHVVIHYRKPDGQPTTEQELVKLALRPLRKLYGHTLAGEFTSQHLKAVRQEIIDKGCGKKAGKGCNRKVTNQHVGRIVRCFRWGSEEKLVPASVWQELRSVAALVEYRSVARESKEVPPASEESIRAAQAAASPVLAAMMEFHLWTGSRPGEVCQLKPCHLLKESGEFKKLFQVQADLQGCWVFLPDRHKSEHHGKDRIIPVGPRAQAALAPFLEGCRDDEYVFSPGDSKRWYQGQRFAGRSSKRQKVLQYARRWAGDCYSSHTYNDALRKCLKRANRQRAKEDLPPLPEFHAHQLRHNAATRLKEQFGWEIAMLVLGHSNLQTTQIYVQQSLDKMFAAMAQSG